MVALEIIVILVLILVNGFLAMAEIAVVSARQARLLKQAEDGDEKAKSALELARQPSAFLSTIQVGITLSGIMAGAFGGATISHWLATQIERVAWLAPYSETLAFVLVVIIITYLTLIFGELVPKRLALTNPEGIAGGVARPMMRLSRAVGPLVHVLSASTDWVLHFIGVKTSADLPVTEDEIKVLIDQGTKAGIFEEAEQDMVAGVFRLGDRTIGSLMTTRREIIWLDLDDPPEVNQRKIAESGHPRLPVARGSLDDVQGIVLAKDLLARSLSGLPFDLMACLGKPVFVPESMPALQALEVFRRSHTHLLFVIDEFGGLQGMVTISDVLESIAGEFPALGEAGAQEIVEREDGSLLVDGMLPIDELMEALKAGRVPDKEKGAYQTLGGLVMSQLGRIPTTGDRFEWAGIQFEVVDMDGLRVDKVLIVPRK